MQLSTYHWQVWWSYWGTSNWLNWLVLLSNENLWLNSTLMVKLLTRDCSPTQSAPQCALEWWQYFYQDNECTLRYPQYGSRFLQNEKNENNKKTFLTKPLMFFFTFRACLFYRLNVKMKSPTQPFWHYRFLNNRGWCYKCATGKEKHFIVRQREQRTKIKSVQHSSQPIYTAVGSLIQFA